MNYSFDFDIPQELRELSDSNIFFKYQIYFSYLTGVLVDRQETEKTLTEVNSNNTPQKITIQNLYLKFEDGSEECIEFINDNIISFTDQLLTFIFVRYPGNAKKEFLAVYNHNFKKSFYNLYFDTKSRSQKFSKTFLKAQFIIKCINFNIISLAILLVIFALISYLFKIDSEIINILIYWVVAGIALILIVTELFIRGINDRLMKGKISDRLNKILAVFNSKQINKNAYKNIILEVERSNFEQTRYDTTDYEYIDEWN